MSMQSSEEIVKNEIKDNCVFLPWTGPFSLISFIISVSLTTERDNVLLKNKCIFSTFDISESIRDLSFNDYDKLSDFKTGCTC